MRTLYLIRHAKSDWAHDDLADIDRPLNDRGYADAPRMALRLAKQGLTLNQVESSLNLVRSDRGERRSGPAASVLNDGGSDLNLVVSSPAVRALTTALIFARELGYPASKVKLDERLYETPPHEVLSVIAAQPASVTTLLVFAHNPTLSHVAAMLTSQRVDMPTCSVVVIRSVTTSWQELIDVGGELRAFEYPKKAD